MLPFLMSGQAALCSVALCNAVLFCVAMRCAMHADAALLCAMLPLAVCLAEHLLLH